MAKILQATTVVAKPGRWEDARAGVAEYAKEKTDAGASVRVFLPIDGEPGTAILSIEYDDAAAWSATLDSDMFVSHRQTANAADFPFSQIQTAHFREASA